MRKLVFGMLITLVLISPGRVQADRAIPDDNLAYPVLVSLNTGSKGSGFFLNTRTGTYLVTAAHVLFDETSGKLRAKQAKLLSYPKDPNETGRNIIQLNLPILFAAKKIRKHSIEDVATVYIADAAENVDTGPRKLNLVPGVSIIEKAPSGILGVGVDTVKHFENVLTANTIYVFGYPTSLGIKEIPQLDPFRPLLRFGIVAGTNPARKTIILDCPSYPGNSGGPVLEVERVGLTNQRFRVIGVVSQFVPFAETWVNITHKYQNLTISNSGYTVAVSMDPVLELIRAP
ncbi:trypsin-like peptidase domain-containing protein [bacterium]|jgi:S1-C subfamily serine protease|nr:trypsin-like peptidase domain-containing protein [bacterium]